MLEKVFSKKVFFSISLILVLQLLLVQQFCVHNDGPKKELNGANQEEVEQQEHNPFIVFSKVIKISWYFNVYSVFENFSNVTVFFKPVFSHLKRDVQCLEFLFSLKINAP